MIGNKLCTEAASSRRLNLMFSALHFHVSRFHVSLDRSVKREDVKRDKSGESQVPPSGAVDERSIPHRRHTVRSAGAYGSENAGMSNDNAGENPARRKPKVSWGR